ncbi:MAG: amidohydrolase family protein [Bacteroidia bacterium]|jgi:imidazolonepropionase-like amidohydrolase|nr:amidohydrolase family protein [Bacteroidia bacterium]
MYRIFLYSIILCAGVWSTAGTRAQAPKGNILIRNGTVLTITRGVLPATDVLVMNGKISQIGKELKAPQGVQVVDATGLYVMPGIIDAHSHLGIDDVNEATNPITAEVFTGDVINPYDINIYRALAGGVTISHALHGSANAIGGQSETLKHRWGLTDPEDLKMEGAPRTIKFALGENPIRVHGIGRNISPRTRMGVEMVFRRGFMEARAYDEAWKKYRAAVKTQPNIAPPAYDLRMETLAAILRGEILVHCHSYRADEIYMLNKVCQEFGIKPVTFQHVNEGFKVAPELAASGSYASVFADWWSYKFEVYYSTAYNAAILTRNGVITSINSDSEELIRHLYHEAAKTQRYGGLTDEEALKLITLNPAIQLGISDRVGSLEVGKEGDIAIFNQHPLSVYAIPQMTIVDGIVRFDISRDPADMRLYVDPTEKIKPILWQEEDFDHCMDGTEALLEEQ